jgi:hypothetical protein
LNSKDPAKLISELMKTDHISYYNEKIPESEKNYFENTNKKDNSNFII